MKPIRMIFAFMAIAVLSSAAEARYYDPATGRFISEDPKGFAAGINFFAYVNNNPINANDPSGMDYRVVGTPSEQAYLNQQIGIINQDPSGSKALALAAQPQFNISIGLGAGSTQALRGAVDGSSNININLDQIANSRALFQQDNTGLYMVLPLQVPQSILHEITHSISPPLPFGTSRSDILTNEYQTMNAYENDMYFNQSGSTRASYGQSGLPVGTVLDATTGMNLIQQSNNSFQGIGNIQIGPSNLADSSAAGGFLIYPNKPNNNGMFGVYRK